MISSELLLKIGFCKLIIKCVAIKNSTNGLKIELHLLLPDKVQLSSLVCVTDVSLQQKILECMSTREYIICYQKVYTLNHNTELLHVEIP